MTTYLYTHLGLGDHIITNGLIRTLISNKPKDQYISFAKYHNHESVSFMYRDLPNIYIQAVSSDADVDMFLADKSNVRRIGFSHVNDYGHIPFDLTFYRQMNIPYDMRWSAFRYKRGCIDREKKIYTDLTLCKSDQYIFVHDDPNRGTINPKYLEGKRVIRPVVGLTNNIFDYVYTIENAKEIHCIDSSFMLLVDSLTYLKSPQFFHKYARKYVPSVYNPVPLCNNNWKVLEE